MVHFDYFAHGGCERADRAANCGAARTSSSFREEDDRHLAARGRSDNRQQG